LHLSKSKPSIFHFEDIAKMNMEKD
jgi:hypothetical protein